MASMIPTLAAAGTGVGAAAVAGFTVGTVAYNNVQFVRDAAGWAVSGFMDLMKGSERRDPKDCGSGGNVNDINLCIY